MAQTEQFISIFFDSDPMKRAVKVEISPDMTTFELFANTNGMGYLATLVSDILLNINCEQLAYSMGVEEGIVQGSPGLRFEFDSSLDNL